MFVGVKPVKNYTPNALGFRGNGASATNSTDFDDWHRFSHRVGIEDVARRVSLDVESVGSSDVDGVQAEIPEYQSPVDRLSVTAHGIDIYKEMPSTFFNAYTPYTYGGHNVNAPEDVGAHMITFCLYPGSYQPSGHVNVSRHESSTLNIGPMELTSAPQMLLILLLLLLLLTSFSSLMVRQFFVTVRKLIYQKDLSKRFIKKVYQKGYCETKKSLFFFLYLIIYNT